MPIERIRLIEELAANAWQPALEQSLEGWRMRYNQGVSRRLNSVWPNLLHGKLPIEKRVEEVENFYLSRETLPRFQICPAALPSDLPKILTARGYSADAYTHVKTAPIAWVLSKTEANPALEITTSNILTDEWMRLYRQSASFDAHGETMRRGTLTRIGQSACFVLIKVNQQKAAIGLGVAERNWVGVFSMNTLPTFRKQGAATTILNYLGNWGLELGAQELYLQVMQSNENAKNMYAKLGFLELYQYYYAEARHLISKD
ncbi:MAG: GNAT family N-acetyltransferase [Chloroflexota bacterium]